MPLPIILRRIALSALFLVPIFALFPMPFWPFNFPDGMFFPFITGKAFYFRILIEIAFACWVILAFLDTKYRPKFSALTIGVTLFALVALLADLLGVNPVRSIWSNFERMEGWLVIAHLWGFYISATYLFGVGENTKKLWHRWMNLSLVVACIVTIYAFVQLLGGAAIHQGSTRLDASLGNAAYLAVYMLMHIGISMYLYFVARAKQIANAGFLQWAYPILAMIFSFIILETQTRGTIIGLIGGVILALALYAIFGGGRRTEKGIQSTENEGEKMRGESGNKKSRLVSAGLIALIIIIGIVFWLNRNSSFIKNIPVLDRIGSISLSDTKTQARAYIWPMAIKGAMERPILGWGQENFNYIFNKDYNPLMWRQEQWFDRAHSVFLDWLVASGIVGLLAYLALYVLLLMTIWRSDLKVAQKSVLTGLVAGYAVHNIFVFDNLASYTSFFALLGFAGSFSLLKQPSKLPKVRQQSKISLWMEQKTFSLDAVEYVVMPIVIVVFITGIYFLNIRPIQANTRLITALSACANRVANVELFNKALSVSPIADQEIREQIISCSGNVISSNQVPGPTKQAFFELANKAIQDQTAYAPNDARMYVLGGFLLKGLSQNEQALPVLEKAHELTPGKQSVSIQLAMLYLNNGKKDEALELLKTTYESDPTYEESLVVYVIGLIAVNKEAEARIVAADKAYLFETENAARAYVSIKQYDRAIDIYKKLVLANKSDVDLRARLAQVYYTADRVSLAVDTLRAIAKDHPEYKDQVEAIIREMQMPK